MALQEAIERIMAITTGAPEGAQVTMEDLKAVVAAAEAQLDTVHAAAVGSSDLDAVFKYRITRAEEAKFKEIKSYVHSLLALPVGGALEEELVKVYRALNRIIALRD